MTALTGLVLYAFYASCDPISTGEVHADDEVTVLLSLLFMYMYVTLYSKLFGTSERMDIGKITRDKSCFSVN